jgi:hypothetical protein
VEKGIIFFVQNIYITMAGKVSVSAKSMPKSFLGFNLSTPAIIAFVAYLILAFVIIMPFEFPIVDENTGKEYIVKYDFAQRLIVLLLMAIPIALSIYTIHCMMAGNCTVWSYVVSILTVFWVGLFVVTAFLYTLRK